MGEFGGPFLLATLAFAIVLVSGALFELMDLWIRRGAPFETILRLFAYRLPSALRSAVPVGVLLGTLVGVGRLGREGERVALRAAGLSPHRVLEPIPATGLVLSAASYFTADRAVPAANLGYQRAVRSLLLSAGAPVPEENLFFRAPGGSTVFVRGVDPTRRRLEEVLVYQAVPGQFPRFLTAAWGRIEAGRWILYDGAVRDLDSRGLVRRELRFDRFELPVEEELARGLLDARSSTEMSRAELSRQIRVLEASGLPARALRVDYHLKLAVPFATFLFGLLGGGLAARLRHTGGWAAGAGLSLALAFLYYGLTGASRALGAGGLLSPVVAAWLPNGIFGGVGILIAGRELT